MAVPLPLEFKLRAAADLTDLTALTISLNITSFSEAGVALAEKSGGLTAANINKANSGIANILGFDHLSTKPIQSSDTTELASATTNEKKLSVLNAAVSNMAATDALGCGVRAAYGQGIDCTVSKLADQFQMSNAASVLSSAASALPIAASAPQMNTAGSTAMVHLSDQGYQAFVGNIAKAVTSGATALANITVDLVLDGAAYATAITTAVIRQEAWKEYRESIKNRNDLIIAASRYYTYAVMSDLVYKDVPDFFPESIWVNGKHPDEPLNPLNSRLYNHTVTGTPYTVLNWQTYGINTEVPNNLGLQWGVFFNNEEIVFAYRGTEQLLDVATDVAILTCTNLQYDLALKQFDILVTNPKFVDNFLTVPGKRRVILTGHSLGGGIASYITTWSKNSSIIDLAVGFNSTPLCSAAAALSGVSLGYHDPKILRIAISGELASLAASLPFPLPGWGYFPGNTVPYPNPYVVAIANPYDSHAMSWVLFALDAAKSWCGDSIICPAPQAQVPSQAIPLAVAGIQSSYSTGVTPYRPAISLSGTNLSAINQISWACTQPNGVACPGSPYIWTPSNWAGKVDIFNDTSIKVYPGLLALGDATGTYNWTATFSAINAAPVSIPFRLIINLRLQRVSSWRGLALFSLHRGQEPFLRPRSLSYRHLR